MVRLIDDSKKQKLIDRLLEEPPMVLATAYAFAKNYVNNGIDITKAWTTAVQQTSILEQVRQKAWVEAYDSFKKDYENRLKADMVAMLTEIQLEIEEKSYYDTTIIGDYEDEVRIDLVELDDVNEVIQQKINSLKEVEE